MTELTDVSEPSLMHNLYMRYCSDQIYTAIGHGILVSLNPYKRLSIYGDMERFRDGGGGGKSSVAEPHISPSSSTRTRRWSTCAPTRRSSCRARAARGRPRRRSSR